MIYVVEYLWVSDPTLVDMRSKTRVINSDVDIESFGCLPLWNFDGSSTGQASTETSEVLLRPIAIYPDPFRGNEYRNRSDVKCILALCECLNPDMTPAATNTRAAAQKIFDTKQATVDAPWFGLEQEYTLMALGGKVPLAWHVDFGKNNQPLPQCQGQHYCGTKTAGSRGRNVAEHHMRLCIEAGLTISGLNAEVLPGQWEFQIGPCNGIIAADQLWVARYLLARVCELHECEASFDPKPLDGDWNGSGCHVNFSTIQTRQAQGYNYILQAIANLGTKHTEAMCLYGTDNIRRLTGRHETSSMTKFTYGIGDRSASVRIPSSTYVDQRGYFEDRRPAANMDPYVVTSFIYASTNST